MSDLVEKMVKVVPSEKQLNWQKLEFTAFIHYGINTFTDREWGTGKEDISIFNPKLLDTDQWCESMQKAGIKGCIITAKHHDGFCLWDTKYTNHCVMNTPYSKDIVKQLSKSTKKYGLKLGIYLSPWDRHEKTYGYGKAYDDYFCSQLEELLTNYGDIYTVWFDGACGEGENGKKQIYDWNRYYKLINKLQPNAVISVCGPDVRWCGNEAGDCRECEWSVVPESLRDNEKIHSKSQKNDDNSFRELTLTSSESDLGSRDILKNANNIIWYPAEVNTSIRPGWFHHKNEDHKVKSLETLISIYLKSVGGNAMFLLNIPPHKDGYFTKYDVKRLEEIGEYIKNSFKNNFIKNAKLSSSSTDSNNVIENVKTNNDTFFKARDYEDKVSVDIELDEGKIIKYIILMEQIKLSQRVENFEILASIDGNFKKIFDGKTIGYKKICKLENAIKAKYLKINFISYRKCPTIKFLGIY